MPTRSRRSTVPSRPRSGAPTRLDRPALHALAHPLRSRLLGQLRVHGDATATELAEALGTNTGATSYHLRRLEEVGLVADTGAGTGRRRVWTAVPERPASEGASDVPDEPLDEDDAAALAWLERDYVDHFAGQAAGWLESRSAWPAPWADECGLADHAVLVSAEQLVSLQAELGEVLARYRRAGAGAPGAKRVVVYTCPLPVDPPPAR
ncbi:MAG TPA: helix-turn-helix domain-containing protein [Segeticoccus sp.]|uniref:helix-turn-helix domain-containing protein n=1 Tax=Segeticoccus sp. TaxID=2706531 RepID=UPI002D8074F7|nr:helix-turn-helix domain-containing protein [Segeticoccus sp.]HET8599232.1 helix-turn-helix domain-containing protein [Segeticoccus sp.]